MLWLRQSLRGVLGVVLVAANTLLHAVPLFAIALARVVPLSRWQQACGLVLVRIGEAWIDVNSAALRALVPVRIQARGLDALEHDRSYLVVANHQSWSDIVVLQYVLNRRVPFLRFFLKQQLFYVPVLGLAWWALDFPFMRRHSAAAVAARPELRAADLEETRRACARYREAPVALLNFVEGTRFTVAKHRQSGSPYTHLLPPKAGGLAFAIGALGDQVHDLIDVTLAYPGGARTFWDFLCGRVPAVVVDVRVREIPAELLAASYADDAAARDTFKGWLGRLWDEKDALLDELQVPAKIRSSELS